MANLADCYISGTICCTKFVDPLLYPALPLFIDVFNHFAPKFKIVAKKCFFWAENGYFVHNLWIEFISVNSFSVLCVDKCCNYPTLNFSTRVVISFIILLHGFI